MKPHGVKPSSVETSLAASDDSLWAHHHGAYRDPRQIVAQWPAAGDIDPATFRCQVKGSWWDLLDEMGVTLIVTREYEHLVQAFCVHDGRPRTSYLPLPHPNGLAVDRQSGRLFIASTRNPNMVYDFSPGCGGVVGRDDDSLDGELLPRQARYYPGCLYLHDIAFIAGRLHGNAVGLNAVVRLEDDGRFEPVWWPRSIDAAAGPRFDKNYLQLNSIAAGATLAESYFGASAAVPSARRPGHHNFPVDGRGVVFSGATRDVFGDGLTRPHSARLRGQELWVDNSGYGETGRIVDGRFEPFARLPGWTRGLLFHTHYVLVGTSRVLPRYRHYAPGLDPDRCCAGVHILDLRSGKTLGSMLWPHGNQLFAIEALPRSMAIGFPFRVGRSAKRVQRGFGAAA
jgi:uncharacterized protein (TIGR03032 family)